MKGYDYSHVGAYFMTICVRGHRCVLSKIKDGEVKLSDYGRVVEEEWIRTPLLRPNVSLDEFVIMPNHIHGIIIINDTCGDDHGHVGAALLFAIV